MATSATNARGPPLPFDEPVGDRVGLVLGLLVGFRDDMIYRPVVGLDDGQTVTVCSKLIKECFSIARR